MIPDREIGNLSAVSGVEGSSSALPLNGRSAGCPKSGGVQLPKRQTHHAALKLADRIRDYWLQRGYYGIRVWVEAFNVVASNEAETMHFVRSNIGPRGYPPRSP